jgi:hypothetical protein
MKSSNRLLLALCLALIASTSFSAPSSAQTQKGEVAALSAEALR